jgi:hypothetical protein
MRTMDAALTKAQQGQSRDPAVKIVLTKSATSYTIEEGRILSLKHTEEPWSVNAKEVVLQNADGYFTSLDLKGYSAVISWGLNTPSGKLYSDTSPLVVTWQQLNSAPGSLNCLLTMLGIPDLMDLDCASASYTPLDTDTKTVKTLLSEVAGATLACFNHCQAYTVDFDSEDSLIDSYKPADTFRIYTGGSRLAAFKRLLEYTGCAARWGDDGHIHIFVLTTAGTTFDSEYSLTSGHVFFSKAYRKSLVLPNYIVVKSQKDDSPQYTGSAYDAASYALLPKKKYFGMRLDSNATANSIAAAILARYQLAGQQGAAAVPMNCGAEVFDYIKVTDSRENDYRVGNVGALTRTWNPLAKRDEDKYKIDFNLGDPPLTRYIKEIAADLAKAGYDFERLTVKDLYAEHIQADSLDMVWIDPEGNIDLSLIGDNLDNLPDGEVYARIKALHLDAGQLKLDENTLYSSGYNPSQKRRTFTATPTTPYDVGDLWLDAATVKRCTTARPTGAYAAGDWTATTLDALADGTTYKRVKSTAINASGMIILDQCIVGTYGLVLTADISAGHILLSSTVKSGEWYDESGVEIDAAHGINIYGTNNALTTRATKAGTIQCYVGSDGKLYAGAGAVILSSAGLTIDGQVLTFKEGSTNRGYIYGGSGYMVLAAAASSDLYLYTLTGRNVYIQTDLVPITDNYSYLGLGGQAFAKVLTHQVGAYGYCATVYCNGLTSCSPLLSSPDKALDIMRKMKEPIMRAGHQGMGKYFMVDDFPEEMKMDIFDCQESYVDEVEDGKTKKKLVREQVKIGRDIDIMRTVGVLVQAVRELTAKVDLLEAK